PFVAAEFSLIPAAIRARFDIITFDPRGFGLSTAVRCFPTAAAEDKFLSGLPPFPVGTQQDEAWERTYARFDARCAQRNGSLLDHDTTADVARDMNLLRQAVGAPRLNYIGLSYGTGLGATYANLFPAAVGHIVLDGNLNLATWTSGGRLPESLRQDSDLASASIMRSFLDLCGQATTTACAFSAGTPAATEAKFGTLLHRLLRHPVTIGTPPQPYTYADVLAGLPLDTTREIASGTVFSQGDWQSGAILLQQLWVASATGAGPAAGSTAGSTANSAPDKAAGGASNKAADSAASTAAGAANTAASTAAVRASAAGAAAASTPYAGRSRPTPCTAPTPLTRAAPAITRPRPGWPQFARAAGPWTGPGPRKPARTGRAARARTGTRARGTGPPPARSW
ncbi:MAG TPA: alpha/beta fold hydrolase, partial [Trebonia sp.]|nr:alpha/beta fold hydrolase [Trebonia sp.]